MSVNYEKRPNTLLVVTLHQLYLGYKHEADKSVGSS